MDIDLKLRAWQHHAIDFVQSLSADDLYNLWLAGGAVLAAVLAWISYRIMRKALGHVQFRNTWYNPHQFEELLKMIDEDNRRGNRVMRRDEVQLLRQEQLGTRRGGVSDRAKGYF
jgi:hypothetical protein